MFEQARAKMKMLPKIRDFLLLTRVALASEVGVDYNVFILSTFNEERGFCMPCDHSGKSDLTLIDNVLSQYKYIPGSLITVLQNAQEIYGHLEQDVLRYLAQEMKLSPAKVFGVATFYTQFRFEPIGKYLILLCQGTACHVNGSEIIEQTITEDLGIGDGHTTSDGLFTLVNVACLGCCSLSPVMMINEDTYGNLTPDKTRKILKTLREVSV